MNKIKKTVATLVKLTPGEHGLLKRAAKLDGSSMSRILRDGGLPRARKIIAFEKAAGR